MESSAPQFHLEVNGIAEGPMTARIMAWKAGTTGPDDVVRFRADGTSEWLKLEGNMEYIQKLAAAEAAGAISPASPPKLKLKKRAESTEENAGGQPAVPESTANQQGFETPPPPPGSQDLVLPPSGYAHTVDNPPPPPGAPGHPAISGSHAYVTPTPQTAAGVAQPYPPPPTQPPVRITTLLIASLLITLGLTGYGFYLMEQDVRGSVRRHSETSTSREIKGLKYAVMSDKKALAWKNSAKAKLAAFGQRAKSEAADSAARCSPIITRSEDIAAKYADAAEALYIAGMEAKLLSIAFDQNSAKDVKSLRRLELAMESAEAYLQPEVRVKMEAGRFIAVANAIQMEGFEKMAASFEAEARDVETRLSSELRTTKPLADEAATFATRTMYMALPEAEASATGSSDALGLFDLSLTPGDYYLVGSTETTAENPPNAWALGFKVLPITENVISLSEANLGTKGDTSLWKPEETMAVEIEIAAIQEQHDRITKALDRLQALRETMAQRQAGLDRLMKR